jgi:ABC-type glycerol-3-phosphate transport system permease component
VLLAPAVLYVALLVGVPFIFSLYLAMSDASVGAPVARFIGLTPFLVLAVFPILWMAITAIKQDADLYLVDAVPFWFRQAPTWKNFDFLFHNTSYRRSRC